MATNKTGKKKKTGKIGAPSKPTGKAPPNKTIAPAEDVLFREKVAKEAKKQKERKAKGKPDLLKNSRPLISIEMYNAMYAAYQERQTVNHVAQTCGISPVTAKKYVEKGDPRRNLRPLAARYKSVINQAQQKEDYDLTKLRGEMLAITRVFMNRIGQKVKALDIDEMSPDAISGHLKNIQVVAERCLGVSDATVTIKSENRFADWTEEELLKFFETGVMPEHDRSVAPVSTAQAPSKE